MSDLQRRCVVPGSFDPVTLGHLDIIERARTLFDDVVVAVVHNPNKHGLFTPAERVELLEESLSARGDGPSGEVSVLTFSGGLLVDLCRELGARAILKGIRGAKDVDYEGAMAGMNRHLAGVETLYLDADPRFTFVSSSLVKEVASRGGDVSALVPEAAARALARRFGSAGSPRLS